MKTEFSIIIIDDNAELADNLKDIFEVQGYEAVIACDGNEAIRLHEENRYDLAFVDIMLPDISGEELISRLNTLPVDNESFVIMTGHASLESAIEAVGQKNVVAYVTKPLDMDQLLVLVKQVYERKQAEYALLESEKKLSESEEKYRTIFESSGTAIVLVEADTTITEVNNELVQLTGYSKDEIEGKMKWTQLIPSEDQAKLLVYDRKRQQGLSDVPVSYDLDYITKSGERRHASITITSFPYSEQSLVSIVDITMRKKTELERIILNEASKVVLTSRDFITAARHIFNYCRDVTGAQSGYIALLNEESGNNEVLFLESGGLPCSVDPNLPMPVRGFREEAYRTGKVIYNNQFIDSNWHALLPDGHVALENVLFAPLTVDKKVVGVIGLANKPSDFNERDVQIIAALSEICSIALVNSRNKELLEKSEETFRLAMDVTNDGLVDWNLDTNTTYYSPNWARILGEEQVEASFESWESRLHPDEAMLAKRKLGQHLKGETPQYYYEHRMKTKDGSWKWVLDRGMVVSRDETGRAVRMVGTMSDITRQKQAEEDLILEKTRVENILKTAQTIILTLDLEGNIVDFNPYMEYLTGYSIDEVRGKSWFDVFFPEDTREEVKPLFQKAIAGDHTEGAINAIVTKAGQERQIVWYDTVIHDEKNRITGLLSTGQDITERIEAEKAVLESEEKFSRVFYSNPNPMIIVAPTTGLINDVNEAFIEFGGYEYDLCIGNTMSGLKLWIIEEDRIDFIKILTDQERIQDFETEMSVASGDIRTIVLSGETIQISGIPFRIVSFNDITERKKIQEQLIVTDRLASVGELAAGIAHELNNPLTGVIGFSDLLMCRDDLPDDIKEDLETINKESIRASQVARHLLTFARKHPDSKMPVNVESVIDNVLALRAYEQTVNNIQVVKDFEPGLPTVMANDFQLQQVFLNIIINAEHFMIEKSGHGVLSITARKKDDEIHISFADDGPGIPQEILPLIFNPFYTTKEVGKGTGLGLSICYGIITEHGGTIYAESKPEAGATFIIHLPVCHEEE